jgi:glycerol-3-phosphate dehydrogenase
MLDAFLDRHPGCSLDDVRRGTGLGMGPCQGGFCTFRAAGVVGERAAHAGAADVAQQADRAILGFLRERFKGTRPIAAGRQLQEHWMISGVYEGGLGVDSLIESEMPEASVEVAGAQR